MSKQIRELDTPAQKRERTKLMIRMFQLRVLQEYQEIPLRKQVLLDPKLVNTLEDADGINVWEAANIEAWNNYAELMLFIEDNEDQNAILFNAIITPPPAP